MKYIDSIIDSAIQRIEKNIRDRQNIKKVQALAVLRRYSAAIEGNFVSWLTSGLLFCRSNGARKEIEDNLIVEIKDDHPGMLREFVKCCNAEPTVHDYRSVEGLIRDVRSLVSLGNGRQILSMLATLELAAVVFMPWLQNMASELGCKNLEYTVVHSDIDRMHGARLLDALKEEMEDVGDDSPKDVEIGVNMAYRLLEGILFSR